jgi:hypothetical protein
LWRRLWNDDCGALLATEWLVVATILVIGLIPGLIALRQGVLTGLVDFGNAASSVDQSYSFCGHKSECRSCLDCDRDGNRSGLATTDRGTRATGKDRSAQKDRVTRNTRDWRYGNGLAYTAGSQYLKPRRPPIQLKQVPPTSPGVNGVQTNPKD